ncbi:MAG TPA: hypothetical protein VHG09_11025 [Longimicrobiales bacterium]|nr:hypothetical protein [Longimicrobiales bacterium]
MHVRSAAQAVVLAIAFSLSAAPLGAQSAPHTHGAAVPFALQAPTLNVQAAMPQHMTADTAVDAQDRSDSDWSALRIGKWTTGVAAAGLAVYGVLSNRRADNQYEDLERICSEDAARCVARLPNGAYADAELEAQYQDVRALDRRTRASLIAGQVGIAASVVLFILDLRNSDDPDNIPYDPRGLDIAPARDGGVSLRLNVPLPGS